MPVNAEEPRSALWVVVLFLSFKVVTKFILATLPMGATLNEIPSTISPNDSEKGTEVLPGLFVKGDGTVVVRNSDRVQATTDPTVSPSPVFVNNVASKDVVIDPATGIWGRVFLPASVAGGRSEKLPIVVYFHGGGFCMGNPGGESPTYQAIRLCRTANVVVISASYRLAPESRLPVPFNDALTTMSWLQTQCKYQATGDAGGDPWLTPNVDFSRVFVAGQSAGGNIAHHVVISKPLDAFSPLQIEGVIPVVPFFSAEELSESEKKFPNDDVLPLGKHHTFWRLALPEGASRDHPFCHPLSAEAPKLAAQKLPRMLLIVAGRDPLHSRQMEYYHALKQAGKEVELVEVPEGTHVFRKNPALEAENVRVDQATSDFIHKSRLS